MDWRAVSALLADGRGPVLVLDGELRVRLANHAFERLVDVDASTLEARSIEHLWHAGSPLLPVAELRRARNVTTTSRIVTQDGRHLSLVIEAHALGDAEPTIAVHVLEAFEHHDGASTDGEPFAYEIQRGVDFGRLVRVDRAAGVRHCFQEDAPRCHDALHDRDQPCSDCPALARRSDTSLAVRCGPDGSLRVLAAHPTRHGTLEICVRRVRAEDVASVRAHELAEALAVLPMSELERVIITRTAGGASLAAIAEDLELTVASVRDHRARVLAKLGADGRARLLRLLL